MAIANKAFTAEEMLGYRDEVVRNLREEISLLKELKDYDLFEKSEGLITKENYPEKIAVIEGEIKKLEHFDVVLAVVGTMKAGKSTTINAIVGREILPNRNRPMTALPTLIYHNPKEQTPVLSFNNPSVNAYVEKLQQVLADNEDWMKGENVSAPEMQELMQQIQSGWHFKEAYTGEKEIFEFLAKLNDLVRLAETLQTTYQNLDNNLAFPFESCCNIDELPKIEVAFRHLDNVKENQGRLILLDTPGPNEAGQTHLRGMLEEQLKRSSAVLLVLDYTQLKSDAGEDVKKQILNVPTVSKERLFALVNKFDQNNANSDDEEETKDIILKDFLNGKVEREHIFPLSAGDAFLANRMQTELELHEKKPAWDKEKWVADFAKLAYGKIKKQEWEERCDKEGILEKIRIIVEDSRIQAPLETAIIQTQLEAPRIAMVSALSQLKGLLEEMDQYGELLFKVQTATTEEKQRLEVMISDLGHQIATLEVMKKNVAQEISGTREKEQNAVKEQVKNTKQNIKDKLEKIFQGTIDSLNEEYNEKRAEGKKLLPRVENKKRKTAMNELMHLIQLNKGDEIVLKTKEELDGVIRNIDVLYEDLLDSAGLQIEQDIGSSLEKIKSDLQDKHEKIRKIFSEIEAQYKKEGINFFLTLPTFEGLEKFKYIKPDIKGQFKKMTKTTKIEKAGFLNKIFRSLGLERGYETKQEEYFIFSKKGIVENLITDLEEEFSPYVQKEVDRVFNSLREEWVEDYIGRVHNRAENLKKETEFQINTNRIKISNKDEIERIAKNLQKRNKQIKEDIQKVAATFKVIMSDKKLDEN